MQKCGFFVLNLAMRKKGVEGVNEARVKYTAARNENEIAQRRRA